MHLGRQGVLNYSCTLYLVPVIIWTNFLLIIWPAEIYAVQKQIDSSPGSDGNRPSNNVQTVHEKPTMEADEKRQAQRLNAWIQYIEP